MEGLTAGLLLATAARVTVVLVLLVVAMRLFGRRHTGELNLYDLMLVLIIANAVQNAMTQGRGQLAVAVVAGGTLIALGRLGAWLRARRPGLERRWLGAPVVLAYDGRLLTPNMRRESVTKDEVMAEVRKQGIADLAKVKLVVLEIDGSISVVPAERDEERAT